MVFTETQLKGAFIVDVEKNEDPRGFFTRIFCKKEFGALGLETELVQGNMSYNHRKGTFRGLHYQRPPYGEVKLVRCTNGALYDVIVDLRPDSSTFKQWIGVELTAENFRMLYVPKGFGHGFITLEDQTVAQYMVTEFYTPGAEGGIKWNDPQFGIELPIPVEVISDKDNNQSYFSSL
jgi:dTDP-4-dehydrorhamnose 3,5-epimerase